MRVLYISDRQAGGIVSHVKCLTSCLPSEVERYVIGLGGDEPFAGTSGHDWREWFQIRRVIRDFRPDVIHFHTNPLLMELYVKWFGHTRVICSIHTPSSPRPRLDRRLVNWAAEPCYWLPVSQVNWARFKTAYPQANGEVFFNPIRLGSLTRERATVPSAGFVVGMVGRSAPVKDWPSFHRVEEIVRATSPEVSFLNAGEEEYCDGRDALRRMSVLMITSISEELPTVVLEAFALGTPVCGFIPKGGMHDILAFSQGPLREVFIEERSVEKLAAIVTRLKGDADLRRALVIDGRQIVENHFDAEKNVRGRLMELYRGVWEM